MKRAISFILVLFAMWLAVVAFRSRVEAYFSQFAMWQANRTFNKVGNPLYPDMVEVGKRYGLDVSFMKNPIRTRANNLRDSEIFTHLPGYYDVLVFGDSSLVWSFSPQIMEQLTGKHVGFFGAEAAQPLQSLVTLAEQMAKTYLKRDGTVVFLFASWTWGISSGNKQWVAELEDMAKASQAESVRSRFERTINAILGLPQLQAYAEIFEPHFAPARYQKEHAQMFGRGCTFYSWGLGSNAFLLYCDRKSGVQSAKDPQRKSVLGGIPSCANYQPNEYIVENLQRFSRANFPKKMVALPLIDHEMAPELYCEALKPRSGLTVLDLPTLADKMGISTLEYEQETHLANTSTILASVVLARAIEAALH